ncbi:hypothetical protein MPHO_39020 [Mycolicibacterium phocaicum]|nr:hypothetical protein MPHO_39020 [Mycolicibacterium phocaicum]GCA97255.1 hypothetical protein NCCNTM_08900 [Mycolicibacterium sp. NCC-Tsukiji]
MSLSIADIDRWSPEAITAVGAAATARAKVASQAGSRLKNLPVFDSWQGEGAKAAQARTYALAAGLERHGQAASAVAVATAIAANEVRQVKTQLVELRSVLGQYGITVDANGSRAVPPTNLSSLPAATRRMVQDTTTTGQQSLDRLRQAADTADSHLAAALKTKSADFDLDTQYSRAQGLREPVPAGFTTTDCINATLTVIQITIATYTIHGGGGSNGKHCK